MRVPGTAGGFQFRKNWLKIENIPGFSGSLFLNWKLPAVFCGIALPRRICWAKERGGFLWADGPVFYGPQRGPDFDWHGARGSITLMVQPLRKGG